jgi:hypothetical protein
LALGCILEVVVDIAAVWEEVDPASIGHIEVEQIPYSAEFPGGIHLQSCCGSAARAL